MIDKVPLTVGVRLKEVATSTTAYQSCTVLHADTVGLVFEVERNIAEAGVVETVVSQILVPWTNILHVILMEERT
jgi:hypothetical protein